MTNCNEHIPSKVQIKDLGKPPKSLTSCKVCGTGGAQTHYGGICCVSCKMFFRRNAQYNLNENRCVFNEKCDITINSRRACRYCRLRKCFAIGMHRELLRASHHRPGKSNDKIHPSLAILASNNVIFNQQSLLTGNQWCRITNVINSYDTKSSVSHIRYLLSNQSRQPMKMRLKSAKTNILDIIMSTYQALLPFIESLPEFQNMRVNDRCELIERNLSCVGGFNGIIVFRDAEVVLSTAFKNGFPSIYGSPIVDDSVMIARRTDNDLTLIKLFIPILLFSASFYVTFPRNWNIHHPTMEIDMTSVFFNTKYLFDIQNVYIEIMFKYMIYRFGYSEASLRFAALIKSLLDQSMCIFRAREVQAHDQLIQTIVKETETVLTLQDESMDYTIL